jgi:hypothetical protein
VCSSDSRNYIVRVGVPYKVCSLVGSKCNGWGTRTRKMGS